MRIWSDEKQSLVLDKKKPEASAVEQVAFYSAKGQEATPLVAETIEQIAQQMRSLFRDARAGLLPTGDASKLCFVLSQLAGLVESATFEKRLFALERKHDEANRRT